MLLVLGDWFALGYEGRMSMRVLIYTNSRGSFNGARDFSLSKFISMVAGMTHPATGEAIEFVKGFRGTRPPNNKVSQGADLYGNLVGGEIKLDEFVELWLFGTEQSPTQPLNRNEVDAVNSLMMRGGGVFATGDHLRIGADLGSQLPRVKSMRLWEDGPTPIGPDRNDTLRPGADGIRQRSDESDMNPQIIQPVMTPYGFHPVLRDDFFTLLLLMPDHMHEGECVTPPAPSDAEYPTGPVLRPLPEIIARSFLTPGAVTIDDIEPMAPTSPSDARTSFASLAAYDGHLAGIGRVVTDSSFHHYMNVNLVGRQEAPLLSGKTRGFQDNPGMLDLLTRFYRNLVAWLLPPRPNETHAISISGEIRTGHDDKRNETEGHTGTDVTLSLNTKAGPRVVKRWSREVRFADGQVTNFNEPLPPTPLSQLRNLELQVDLGEGGKTPSSYRDNWELAGLKVMVKDHLGHTHHFSETAISKKFVNDEKLTLGFLPEATVRFGSIYRIRHVVTLAHLHSHEVNYPSSPESSGQQQITAFSQSDDNDWWRVRPAHGIDDSGVKDRPVHNGDKIRLQHLLTGRNLHSRREFKSPASRQQEVCCFDRRADGKPIGFGDTNCDWLVELNPTDNALFLGAKLRLIHAGTSVALHSHAGFLVDPYAQQEVTGYSGRDDNDLWYFLGPIFPTTRA